MVDLLLVILAIFIPPLAVYLHQKSCNNVTLLNLLLTLLGFGILGMIHAFWVITR